jgi:hypothetical protein
MLVAGNRTVRCRRRARTVTIARMIAYLTHRPRLIGAVVVIAIAIAAAVLALTMGASGGKDLGASMVEYIILR